MREFYTRVYMVSESDLPEYLKTAEVARILSVDPRTVIKMIREGKIESITVAGRYRIRKDEVLRITGQKPTAGAVPS